MNERDKKIRSLLKKAEQGFKETISILEKAGELLVEKAKEETGADLKYSIGWEGNGYRINSIILYREDPKTYYAIPTSSDEYGWYVDFVQPLEDELDLEIIHIDMLFDTFDEDSDFEDDKQFCHQTNQKGGI